MKKILLQLLFLSMVVVGSLIQFDQIYRQVTGKPNASLGPIWKHASIEDPYEIVAVGNSHAQDAITFERFNLRGLQLSGVAQRFRFDRVLLQQYENQIADNAIILIDVSHISFSHRKADQSDGMQGNYYGRVSPFLIPDLKVSDYLQVTVFPFLRTGSSWRNEYAQKVKDRISEEERWKSPDDAPHEAPQAPPFYETHEYFTYVDAIKHELRNPRPISNEKYIDNMNFIFNKWYETDEFSPDYFSYNRKELEKLISYCIEQNWRPVLLTIPVTSVLEDGLLDDYKQVYIYDNLEKSDLQGAPYFDFTTRADITENMSLFGNADHLNWRGGLIFSYVLLQELIEKGYLSEDSDGYDSTTIDIPSILNED